MNSSYRLLDEQDISRQIQRYKTKQSENCEKISEIRVKIADLRQEIEQLQKENEEVLSSISNKEILDCRAIYDLYDPAQEDLDQHSFLPNPIVQNSFFSQPFQLPPYQPGPPSPIQHPSPANPAPHLQRLINPPTLQIRNPPVLHHSISPNIEYIPSDGSFQYSAPPVLSKTSQDSPLNIPTHPNIKPCQLPRPVPSLNRSILPYTSDSLLPSLPPDPPVYNPPSVPNPYNYSAYIPPSAPNPSAYNFLSASNPYNPPAYNPSSASNPYNPPAYNPPSPSNPYNPPAYNPPSPSNPYNLPAYNPLQRINSYRSISPNEENVHMQRFRQSSINPPQWQNLSQLIPFYPQNFMNSDEFYGVFNTNIDSLSYEELISLEDRIGNVSNGLSDSELSVLKSTVYPSKKKSCCSICLSNLMQGDKILLMQCVHFFHENCIKSWLKIKNQCPVCKEEVVKKRRG